MSKLSLALTLLFATVIAGGAALGSQAAPAAAPATTQEIARTSCSQMICHSNEDCGFPDVCGGCKVPSGSFTGHCLPTP